MKNKNNYNPKIKITEVEIASVLSMIIISVILGFLSFLIKKEPNWMVHTGLLLMGAGIYSFIISFWYKFSKKRSKNANDE